MDGENIEYCIASMQYLIDDHYLVFIKDNGMKFPIKIVCVYAIVNIYTFYRFYKLNKVCIIYVTDGNGLNVELL